MDRKHSRGSGRAFFGIVVRAFNASGLIAGYNTAPAEERARYDEKVLARFTGNLLIAASALLLAGGVLPIVPGMSAIMAGISWLVFLAIVIGGVVSMKTGDRFKRQA
ncbi:DUF3784 domain-containing protein [Methanoculleus horonobensis]|uniref:DUF3784 domain-containing protein n=1 Tax=Methanoculleus horonobensis TaxID=528314 RepID=UPI000830F228|nr:DUF3784 domain-containing protein [Methanoculleus horonobensis]MDD3069690.1 DUF3784 domain-containing protein [Methanoculleus horonobensis]MDD4252241.1 DUF3784 domain-containing protein [Methanoculleus horonobensis]